MTDIQN